MIRLRSVALAFWIAAFAAGLAACALQDFFPSDDPASVATSGRYQVKAGDTFTQIADFYGITVEQLIVLNRDIYPQLARDPSLIKPGMPLIVPNAKISRATRAALTAQAPIPRVDLDRAEQLIILRINDARAKSGIGRLKLDSRLARIAADRSSDMILRSYFSHTDPYDAQEPFLRYLRAMNYPYRYAGENIAEIKNEARWVPSPLNVSARFSADDLVEEFTGGWIKSIEHLANITNKVYTRTGVALAASDDGSRIVATQVFSD